MNWISVKDREFPSAPMDFRARSPDYLVYLSGGGSIEYFVVTINRWQNGKEDIYSACINHSLDCGTHTIYRKEILFWLELPLKPE